MLEKYIVTTTLSIMDNSGRQEFDADSQLPSSMVLKGRR